MRLVHRPEINGKAIDTYGFQFLGLKIHRLAAGEWLDGETGNHELGVVLFGGKCSVESSAGAWPSFGGRRTVFDGLPYALYLPITTRFRLVAEESCEFAACYCKAERAFPARLVTPADVDIEIRGGGNATRQINGIFKPDFPADRLMVVEVYTPSGNWSSYPPHKHDVHNLPSEADLEEFYYYRMSQPAAYAIQKVYTSDRRIDETMTVRDGELVLVPEGYHPVVAAHGYDIYYLNALAGSARSMAASDDPDYAWVRQTWADKDPRLPLVR
jgi:5-deoxy-glucuronate isomerase